MSADQLVLVGVTLAGIPYLVAVPTWSLILLLRWIRGKRRPQVRWYNIALGWPVYLPGALWRAARIGARNPRRTVGILAATAIFGCLAFPPWLSTHRRASRDWQSTLYAPLWSPPAIDEYYAGINARVGDRNVGAGVPWIKTDQLALEVLAVVAIGAFLLLAFRQNAGARPIPAQDQAGDASGPMERTRSAATLPVGALSPEGVERYLKRLNERIAFHYEQRAKATDPEVAYQYKMWAHALEEARETFRKILAHQCEALSVEKPN